MVLSSVTYDYDAIQPYFLLDGQEEEFFPPTQSHFLPGPGEDIWKKFELLPTPPLSPSRTPPCSDAHLSAAEHLEVVSDLLDEDSTSSAALLQSFIIQDCMWSSSFAAATKLEKIVSERLAPLRARRDSSDAESIPDGAAGLQVCRSQVKSEQLQDFHAAASAFINPSVVFPFAATGKKQSRHGATVEVGSELDLDSLPLSSTDSESAEEEEEEEEEEEKEEEEEEEEEEIDVVTVDRRRTSRRSDLSPLVLKRSHINVHQHNYAALQPAGKRRKAEGAAARLKAEGAAARLKAEGAAARLKAEGAAARLKAEGAAARLKAEGAAARRSSGRWCWSPRSDGEGGDKRRTHNVLERQRRDELRASFLRLRGEVPQLESNEKAAKVLILKTATDFITALSEEEERLLLMKDELMKRSRKLKRRLQQLRT